MPSKHAAKNRRRLAEQARLAAAVERQAALPARPPRKASEQYQPRGYGRPGGMAATQTVLALLAGSAMAQRFNDETEVRAEALRRLEINDYGR